MCQQTQQQSQTVIPMGNSHRAAVVAQENLSLHGKHGGAQDGDDDEPGNRQEPVPGLPPDVCSW